MQRPFNEVLKELLKARGITQKNFSSLVGASCQSVNQWVHGSVEPSFEKLRKIANVLNVPTDYLLGMEPRCHFWDSERFISDIDQMQKALVTLKQKYRSIGESTHEEIPC